MTWAFCLISFHACAVLSDFLMFLWPSLFQFLWPFHIFFTLTCVFHCKEWLSCATDCLKNLVKICSVVFNCLLVSLTCRNVVKLEKDLQKKKNCECSGTSIFFSFFARLKAEYLVKPVRSWYCYCYKMILLIDMSKNQCASRPSIGDNFVMQ